ncbi:MAG: Imidazoleglycerol-phosphate dehydratase [Clostridia bacterium 41_269]|nr:MAG: Imidazoleglycerol-phosphate dehydratase [Clostridia bacterium 41_269]
MKRVGRIKRITKETDIEMELLLDGSGNLTGKTGVPFFDHMLQLWTYHSGFDLKINVEGDLEVDGHHTVEDVGICMGQCFKDALGDKLGINRYGLAVTPMDEALVMSVVDLSGRSYLSYEVTCCTSRVGSFDVELVEEFLRAFCSNSGTTLHIKMLAGKNTHHILEAVFKSFARALKEAALVAGNGIPSTKGFLE